MADGNNIHKVGAEAVALLSDLRKAKAARKTEIAKADDLIEERNEAVKPLLKQVHDHIAGGDPVNGCSTWAAWAKYAGWSKRALNYIINGRKPQGGNSSSRVVVLKPRTVVKIGNRKFTLVTLGDSTAPSDWEDDFGVHSIGQEIAGCDCNVQLNLKEIDPKAAPVRHIKFSPRKTLCQIRFVNRKIKCMVFAKDGETVTCLDCARVRDGQLGGGTLQKVRDEKNKKEEVPAPIKIKLTKAQAREVRITGNLSLGSDWEKHSRTLEFHPNLYELQAKQLVEALEQRVDDLTAESKALRKTMSDWNDKSSENVAKFKEHAGIDGAIKACNAAIREITFGDVESDDPARNIREWYDQRRDEQLGISEPAKALDATVDGAELMLAQKVVIPGSPERLQWAADLKKRRENLPYDPNEDEDCEEDCTTEEDS